MEESVRAEIRALIQNAKNAFVASVDQDGYPNIKAMFALDRDDVKVFYFSTNVSSRRVGQFKVNPRASVYFCDEARIRGVMLTGDMEVCRDRELRTRLWKDGFECYYPKGVDDEDYCVLRFTARTGAYWPGHPETFSVEDL